MLKRHRQLVVCTVALLAALAGGAYAPAQNTVPGPTPSALSGIGIDQNLGAQVPPDLQFRDETGAPVRLGDYFGKRPIILTPVYFDCPMLCTTALNDLTREINGLTSLHLGKDYDIITFSIDPHETPALAAKKKASYLHQLRRSDEAAEGWHFLTGAEDQIKRLTDTVGFHYRWEPSSQSFAHASGLMILRPDGQVSRYFFGTQFEAIELKGALKAAQVGEISAPVTKVLFYCFQYDPATGRVGLIVTRAVRVGGVLTVLLLGSFIVVMVRREHRRPPTGGSAFPVVEN